MDISLLATKVRIPPPPQRVVRRDRLIDALERGISHHRLVLLAAPAGYGKTTLLAQWAQSSDFSTAWLSIDPEDNELERFLRCLFSAWEQVQPGIRESKLGMLLGTTSPDHEAILSAFINLGSDLTQPLVVVLDDYHLIQDASIHEALSFLLDHLPSSLHFVMAGRAEPPLPLARYRARQELLEFRADDLQFLEDETVSFLSQSMKLDLSHDEVIRLHAQLEGWIAGLQLVALSRQRRLVGAERLAISGKQRFIADFLSEDVLARLTAHMRQFLLRTSILDRLCGPLCDAVTGQAGSQAMLEIVERENLFVVPLDDNREWFRYHHLFADFLYEELKRRHPDEVDVLHRRAGRWYLAHDLPDPAFHHAIEGSDVELAVNIVERYCNAKLNSGEIRVVQQWVNTIPAEWYAVYPVLGLARVGFLAFTGAFEASMRELDEVEQQLAPIESENRQWQLAHVSAVRCMLACIQNDLPRSEAYADQALQELPEDDLNWRPAIYGSLGDAYRQHGRWDRAKECYLNALSITDSPGLRHMSLHVFGGLADLALRQGRLREAETHWKKALAVIQARENWGRLELPVVGWVFIRLGELLYEQNELAQAWDYLSQGLERAELGGDGRSMIAGYLIAGRLKLTEDNPEAALDYLERAHPLVESVQFAPWTSRFERLQIELWLAQDRLRAAVDWSDAVLRDSAIEERPESESVQLAIARLLIAKADVPSIGRAGMLLKRLLQVAEEEGRMGIQIEALALHALADWSRGDRAGSMTALERALRTAEPEGYVRLFADLGLPMARLLQEARSRGVMPDYVAKLLVAIGGDLSISAATEAALTERLSLREQEVLELIAAGLTNQEIADKLVISPETVKKHTGTIYSKLGVRSRTEAVARARALDLLI